METLQCSVNGLGKYEVEKRTERYELNELNKEESASPLKIFAEQFKGFLIGVRLTATFLSMVIG